MIYPRLRLAKDLLSEDGVIIINMDENEITNLQNICAEVFGSSNDLGTIIWDKRNPKGDAQGVSYQHEYILVYAKNKVAFASHCKMQRPKKNAAAILKKASQLYSKLSASYTLSDINADFAAWMRSQNDFSGGEKAYNKIDENGDVYRPVSMAWPNKKKAPDDYFIPLIHPVTGKPCPIPERGWRNPSATMKKMLESGLILFGKDETTIPNSKYLLKENMYENIPSILYYGGSDTDMLSQLGIPFDTPKVVSICIEHIRAFTNHDDIILDFFSGSATTAHAVMQLNAEDGGHRKFIMVQLPEQTDEKSEAFKAGYKNICEIGKERIRRAGRKIKEDAGLTAPADLDIGFRCLRLDESNMQQVYYTPDAVTQQDLFSMVDNVKPDRTPEDLLFQVMLDLGVLLSSTIEVIRMEAPVAFRVSHHAVTRFIVLTAVPQIIRSGLGKIILVDKVVASVVGRVDIDHLDLAQISLLQQLQDFQIVALDIKIFAVKAAGGAVSAHAVRHDRAQRGRNGRVGRQHRLLLVRPGKLIPFLPALHDAVGKLLPQHIKVNGPLHLAVPHHFGNSTRKQVANQFYIPRHAIKAVHFQLVHHF